MSGNTPRYGIPYPTNNDAVDVPGDMQNLAEYLDTTVLPSLVTGDNVIPITVDAGVVVNAGDPFYIVGETTLATVPPKFAWKVERSLSTDPTTLPAVGIANENILADALSYGTIVGPVDAELDTGSFPLGTVLYVGNSTALTGYNLTSTPPSPTEQLQRVAVVTKSDNSTGSITFIPSDTPRVRLDTDQTWDGSQTFVGDTTVPDRPPLDTESNAANTRYVQTELERYGPLLADNTWVGNNVWGGECNFNSSIFVPNTTVNDQSFLAINTQSAQNKINEAISFYAPLSGATFSGNIYAPGIDAVSINATGNIDADNINATGDINATNMNVSVGTIELANIENASINSATFINPIMAPNVLETIDEVCVGFNGVVTSSNPVINSSSTPIDTGISITHVPRYSRSNVILFVNVGEVTKIGNSTGAVLELSIDRSGVQQIFKFASNAGNNGTSQINNIGTVSFSLSTFLNSADPVTFSVLLSNSSDNQGSVSVSAIETLSSIYVLEFFAE